MTTGNAASSARLIVEAAAAARTDEEARRLLHDAVGAKLDEWASDYRAVWRRDGLDPEVDPEAVMLLLFAAEIGLGILEAIDVEPPKPGILASVIETLVGAVRRA